MAKQNRRPAPGGRRSGAPGAQRGRSGGKSSARASASRAAPAKRAPAASVSPDAPEEPRIFRLGVIPGAMPGKWVDAWKERMPHVEIELHPISTAEQRGSLNELDAALVRLPIERADELHVIRLYDETPVVVASADSHLMAVDRLTADDLVGEVLITPIDDVLGPLDLPTIAPNFPPIATTEDAVATVASGVGILVVPMSLARLHHRKDADYRPLLAGPTSTVALAWRREHTTPDIETFVGIVRGRTANSSR